jgi:hypothetical protein
MDFGHTESPTKRASSDSQGGRRRRKRDGNVSGDETDQVMALQVDLGSSDMVSFHSNLSHPPSCQVLMRCSGSHPQHAQHRRASQRPPSTTRRYRSILVRRRTSRINRERSQERSTGRRLSWEDSGLAIRRSVCRVASCRLDCQLTTVVAADAVTDEDLSGGQYSGVLGLARELIRDNRHRF